jgi:hypothetical protein
MLNETRRSGPVLRRVRDRPWDQAVNASQEPKAPVAPLRSRQFVSIAMIVIPIKFSASSDGDDCKSRNRYTLEVGKDDEPGRPLLRFA